MGRIKAIFKILLLLSCIGSLFLSVSLIYQNYRDDATAEEEIKKLSQSFIRETGYSDEVYIDDDVTIFKNLKARNSDIVGYLRVPNSKIAYPVMQSLYEPDFYLSHNIDREYSFCGTPYLSAYCDLYTSDNLIIYGHNINGGRMFGQLIKYEDEEFYRSHREIIFTTNITNTYEVFAVLRVNKYDFEYWKFVMAKNESQYDEFIKKVKEYSSYNTGITPTYNDKLITLSTCDNQRGNNYRFVVLGVKRE